MKKMSVKILSLGAILMVFTLNAQKKYSKSFVKKQKQEIKEWVESEHKNSQVMVDKIFSFAELGFHEVESLAYLTSVLEKAGFDIEYGVSDIPTAWFARWKNGDGPIIALGSDVDCIPKASQYPGVAYHKPMVEGAPGHGEGHNAGIPLNVTAAIGVKQMMEEHDIPGTLVVWPGIAEELVASKAWFVRDGYFDDIDMCIFTHVSSNLSVSW